MSEIINSTINVKRQNYILSELSELKKLTTNINTDLINL